MFDKARLEERLKDQIQFLINSAYHFDLHHICEGRRMAIHLNIILIESGKGGQSLLRAVYGRKRIENIGLKSLYLTEEEELAARKAYIETQIKEKGINPKKIFPLDALIRDSGPSLILSGPNYEKIQPALSPFLKTTNNIREWLTMEVATLDERKSKINREFLIKNLRNFDGGAHVDLFPLEIIETCSSTKNEKKKQERQEREQHFKFSKGVILAEDPYDGSEIKTRDPHLCMLRQFTHELLMSNDLLTILGEKTQELVYKYQQKHTEPPILGFRQLADE